MLVTNYWDSVLAVVGMDNNGKIERVLDTKTHLRDGKGVMA